MPGAEWGDSTALRAGQHRTQLRRRHFRIDGGQLHVPQAEAPQFLQGRLKMPQPLLRAQYRQMAGLQLLQAWCREHDVLFILDEVQSSFGRTGRMYAFEKYEIQPDFVCLGKGMGNGVPVNAAVGRADVLASL